MRYKKWLINCIRILFIIGIVILLNRIFIPKYSTENQDGRITREFYQEKTPIDVLAVGSSTVYNAVSPDYLWQEYGFTSYVRANASQTMWQSYYLLKDALRTKTPSLVIADMSFMKYGEEFVEEPSNRKTIEGMRNTLIKYECIKASMWEEEQPVTYFFPIFRYHSRWKELSSADFLQAFSSKEITYDGFLMEFDIPDEQTVYEMEEQQDYSFPQKAVEYLDKMTKLCSEKNIPLLLMKTPTYVNNWYPEYDEYLEKYAAEHGIKYQNFDDDKEKMESCLRTDYIDDGSHLNIVGAEKFSKFLGSYIQENYEISDRTNDEQIKKIWDKKAARYNQDKEEGLKGYKEKLSKLQLTD